MQNIKIIHQKDGIYQGTLNSSYQKNGYGIFQSLKFETYIGEWRNNHAHGLGLIIYPSGSMIYGNFKDDKLSGVAITDNHQTLTCGVYRDYKMVQIGFEYHYQQQVWKMNKYYRGICIQTIREQSGTIDSIPKMMNIEQNLFILLNNYLNKKLFQVKTTSLDKYIYEQSKQNQVPIYYHEKNSIIEYYGLFHNDQKSGLGVQYNKKEGKVCQVGNYKEGKLYGYAIILAQNNKSIGLYKGKKDGLFYEKVEKKQVMVQYRRDKKLNQFVFIDMKTLQQAQRIYHYQQKNYLSTNTIMQLESIEIKIWSQKKTRLVKKKNVIPKNIQFDIINKIPDLKKVQQIKKQPVKSSLEIIHSKLQKIKKNMETNKNLKHLNKSIEFKTPNKSVEFIDEEIAEENNPFNPRKSSRRSQTRKIFKNKTSIIHINS